MRIPTSVFGLSLLVLLAAPAAAQFKKPDPQGAPIGQSQVQRWRAGVIITAAGGTCTRLVATVPVPVDWPEQQVKITKEDVAPTARLSYQTLEGGVKQMVVTIPQLQSGDETKALVELEVRRSVILPPDKTDRYQYPDLKKLDRLTKSYLGPSPLIESRHKKIVALSKKIAEEHQAPWERVEAFYDWVREHVKYENGSHRGALAALDEGTGDCEEITALFIALCRASDIPARTVHVPGHCYPEFYLVDEEGKGHWFPSQSAGSRSFGGIPETRPILQKGDNFKDPRNPRERYHYLPEMVNGSGMGGKPQVRFIRELLPN